MQPRSLQGLQSLMIIFIYILVGLLVYLTKLFELAVLWRVERKDEFWITKCNECVRKRSPTIPLFPWRDWVKRTNKPSSRLRFVSGNSHIRSNGNEIYRQPAVKAVWGHTVAQLLIKPSPTDAVVVFGIFHFLETYAPRDFPQRKETAPDSMAAHT
jgi:hypothetical protein